jgi:hypothetical protein
MSGVKIFTIVTFILSLIACVITIASQAFAFKFYQDNDSASGTTTNVDTNKGYVASVLALASLSLLGYIALLVIQGL